MKPRSRCNSCERQIAWYDNIPILSYLLLRGCCRCCGAAIHWRYPTVEALTAMSFAWFVGHLGLGIPAVKMCLFSAIMIGLVFSDFETRLLPDEFTIGGILLGIAASLLVPLPDSITGLLTAITGVAPLPRTLSLSESLLGATLPSGALWLMGWLFEKIRHKEGLGFGDVKMIAMIGAFLGLRDALLTTILGSLLGSIIGLTWIKVTGQDASEYQLPFGSFLGAAALVVAAEGPFLNRLYG